MMKPINTARFVFLSRSVNESFARGALAAFLAQADPTVPQLADIKTAVSEAVTGRRWRPVSGWRNWACASITASRTAIR